MYLFKILTGKQQFGKKIRRAGQVILSATLHLVCTWAPSIWSLRDAVSSINPPSPLREEGVQWCFSIPANSYIPRRAELPLRNVKDLAKPISVTRSNSLLPRDFVTEMVRFVHN